MKQAIIDWWTAVVLGLKDPWTWLWTFISVMAGLFTYALLKSLGF